MAKTQHGGRVIVKIDGRVVIDITRFEIIESYPQGKVKPLGQIGTREIITLDYDISGSFESYRVSERSLTALGIEPRRANLMDLLNHPSRTLQVVDPSDAGRVLERCRGFKIEEKSTNYAHGEISMVRVRWTATLNTDEAEN